MTDILQHNVRCPDCNTESPFTLYRSLNVTLNPADTSDGEQVLQPARRRR